ncbi:MAG: DUF2314 domain-containing protein [Planctomycetota bacterium]|nr:DUF2314 domain-containing protein [Planctomycetota bacterium]
MNRLKTVTNRPWWSVSRRGSATALRVVVILILAAGMIYKAQTRKAKKQAVEAQGGVMVDSNDPELIEIRRDALANYPEFETAFKLRDQSKTGDDAQVFAVKCGFKAQRSDDEEFMWIQVTNIMDTSITGIVVEEPFGKIGYHAGDTVTVNPKKIEDWYYTDVQGGEHGGKSNAALERRK